MAQNENGEETQKSEHGRRRVIVSSTIVLSRSEADGGRCGQQVVAKKVLAAADFGYARERYRMALQERRLWRSQGLPLLKIDV